MRRAFIASCILFALAFASLLLPLAMGPSTSGGPAVAHASASTLAAASRWASLALAVGGGLALFLGRPPARRALVLAAGCALLGIVLFSPVVDRGVADSINARYTASGFLVASVDISDVGKPDEAMPVYAGLVDVEVARSAFAPIAAARGDTWTIILIVRGESWDGDDLPLLSTDVPATCEEPLVEDLRHDEPPGIGVTWRCVALAAQRGMLSMELPASTKGESEVHVQVVPTMDIVTTSRLPVALSAITWLASAASIAAYIATRR